MSANVRQGPIPVDFNYRGRTLLTQVERSTVFSRSSDFTISLGCLQETKERPLLN